MSYDTLVYLAKTFGLFWMLGFFVIVAIWTYWPSRRERYRRAARSVLREEDRDKDR